MSWFGNFLQDSRYGLRMLAKNPGFTALAILTLTLGLTVNATVFSFVSNFFLRPLPARNPNELVVICQKSPRFPYSLPLSYPEFENLRRAMVENDSQAVLSNVFSGLIAYKDESVHLGREDETAEKAWLHLVSKDYFDLLGIRPLYGRLFLPEEGRQPGVDPIIVLTYDYWHSHFGGDPRIVGETVKLNGLPFTVVGVTPLGFYGAAYGAALCGFVPATMHRELTPSSSGLLSNRGRPEFFLMGRLKTGIGIEQAQVALNVMKANMVREHSNKFLDETHLLVMRERMSRPSPYVAGYTLPVVSTLSLLALLILVVAAANVVILLYAVMSDRERELAVRGALGATRWRLIRQLVIESVLLAVGAGILGAFACSWIASWLNSIGVSNQFPPAANTGWDWRIIVFTLIASLATGILAGLMPALKATNLNLLPLLKEGTPLTGRTRHPLRSLLVIAQVAVSCVVLICAGLAVRSIHNLSRVDLGFQPDNLLIASFDLDLQRYDSDRGRKFQVELLDKVGNLPGVQYASFTTHVPYDVQIDLARNIHAEGQPLPNGSKSDLVVCPLVDDKFLETAGIPLIEGRHFTAQENQSGARVAVINQTLAKRLWSKTGPIGRRVIIDRGQPIEVIGVVRDIRFYNMMEKPRPIVFQPLGKRYRHDLTLIVRTKSDPVKMMPAMQQVVRQLDPNLPLYGLRTMEYQITNSPTGLLPLRLGATIAGAQGMIALLLAALGIFGLVSYAASCRTREIGIRIALGANFFDVIRLVTFQSLRLILIGLICGILTAFGLTRLMANLLYDVSATDVVVFSGVTLLVIAISILALWLPARRAAKVDPMTALRAE